MDTHGAVTWITLGLLLLAIWWTTIRPVAKLIATVNELLPLLFGLTELFKNAPHAFSLLEIIIKEFKSDSGSTMHDAINRLEAVGERIEKSLEHTSQELHAAQSRAQSVAKHEKPGTAADAASRPREQTD